MQLYITTYFICKIFIGESVMLRTLHKMLQTLHSVNSKNQNCWNKVIVGIKVIVDTKSEQNLILKQRKNLEAEGFVQTCQQQIVLGQRPSTCDSKVKHSKHSEKKLHIIFSQLIRTRAVQSPRFAFSNIRFHFFRIFGYSANMGVV